MRQDILFGFVEGAYDLSIESGDLVIGSSDPQHTWHIMEATQGTYKQEPLVGIGVRLMLNGPLGGSEKYEITKQLHSDGIVPRHIIFSESKILIRL